MPEATQSGADADGGKLGRIKAPPQETRRMYYFNITPWLINYWLIN
jgi:hypothetical protein